MINQLQKVHIIVVIIWELAGSFFVQVQEENNQCSLYFEGKTLNAICKSFSQVVEAPPYQLEEFKVSIMIIGYDFHHHLMCRFFTCKFTTWWCTQWSCSWVKLLVLWTGNFGQIFVGKTFDEAASMNLIESPGRARTLGWIR